RLFLGIENSSEAQEAALQFFKLHVLWLDVQVEERAEFPGAVSDDASLSFKPAIKRRAGKSGKKCDLHFIQPRVADELQNVIENLRRVAIEAENEAAIDRDA